MSNYFEAVFATYGIPDAHGNVLTRQAAEHMAAQVKGRVVEGKLVGVNYRVIEARLEGDTYQGRLMVGCERIHDLPGHAVMRRAERMMDEYRDDLDYLKDK